MLYTAVRFDERLSTHIGVVEYAKEEDMKEAMRKLDGAKLKGARGMRWGRGEGRARESVRGGRGGGA